VKSLLVALLCLSAAPASAQADGGTDSPTQWPAVIDALEIKGLSWTRDFVLRRELPWAVTQVVTEAQWNLGITRLWNTDLFSRIDSHVELRGEQRVAVFDVEERFSLNPLFSFGVGGGAWWFRAGANDVNWLGRFLEWGARYERFDVYNGGQAWVRDPRLFGKRLTGLVQAEYLVRPRPLYARRRLAGLLEVSGEVDDTTRLGVHVDVFNDEYLAPKAGPAELPQNLIAGQVVLQLKVGRVDTVRLRQRGWSLEFKETLGATSLRTQPIFVQSQLELLWFQMLGERWNFAVRAQAALSSAAPVELGYYVGGLDLVRGYADSQFHTLAFALANAEVRATLLDFMWFALVAAAFVDGAVVGPVPTPLLSAGGGLRVLVPRLVKTGIRADLAVTLVGTPTFGVSLGVYQFF
jgi:hypothetical protein